MKIEVVCNDTMVTTYEATAAPRRGERVSYRARLDDAPAKSYRVDDVVHVLHSFARSVREIGRSELSGVIVYVEEDG